VVNASACRRDGARAAAKESSESSQVVWCVGLDDGDVLDASGFNETESIPVETLVAADGGHRDQGNTGEVLEVGDLISGCERWEDGWRSGNAGWWRQDDRGWVGYV